MTGRMTRAITLIVFGLVGLAVLADASPALAQTGPVIVIPRRPGVPVVLHGRDVSYVVVEGDWGLARPGHVTPTIVGYAPPVGDRASPRRGVYHPRYGAAPPRGRNEVEPPVDRPMPDPAENFSRSWGTHSEVTVPRPVMVAPAPLVPGEPVPRPQSFAPPDIVPATITDPQTFMMPPVVIDGRRHHRRP